MIGTKNSHPPTKANVTILSYRFQSYWNVAIRLLQLQPFTHIYHKILDIGNDALGRQVASVSHLIHRKLGYIHRIKIHLADRPVRHHTERRGHIARCNGVEGRRHTDDCRRFADTASHGILPFIYICINLRQRSVVADGTHQDKGNFFFTQLYIMPLSIPSFSIKAGIEPWYFTLLIVSI